MTEPTTLRENITEAIDDLGMDRAKAFVAAALEEAMERAAKPASTTAPLPDKQ